MSEHLKRLRAMTSEERKAFVDSLSDDEVKALEFDWDFWARPEQLEPKWDWTIWAYCAGRGSGKTRCGAETVRKWTEVYPMITLIAPTSFAVRDIMVSGEAGILATSPPDAYPKYQPALRKLTWPNGCVATTFTADEPDFLRGQNHMCVWADEISSWSHMRDAWDMLMFGLRIGPRPKALVTFTPKPYDLIRELIARDQIDVHVTRGSTYDNRDNLAPSFFREIVSRYEGTTLGAQELHGVLLEEAEGALWRRSQIVQMPGDPLEIAKRCHSVAVGVDPAVTVSRSADRTGIVVGGMEGDRLWVLADLTGRYTSHEWASTAIDAYHRYDADFIVAETNNGGDMVVDVIHTIDPNVPVQKVHASRGKRARAEPVAAMYQQGRVYHLPGLQELESQMCTWDPAEGDESPDRLDALTWMATQIAIDGGYHDLEIMNPAKLKRTNHLRRVV